jgi:sulfite oxidase
MGGGGTALKSIELSSNAGRDWRPARIIQQGEHWTWSFWEGEVELSPGLHVLVVRASDVTGATQPDSLQAIWNVKGYNNNAWHRVRVQAA